MPTPLPLITIVGRPNVGKSALFNAILQRRISIVHEQSGVTRDRVAAPGEHFGKSFLLVDTGGLGTLNKEKRKVDLFDGMIREQVEQVVKESSVLIWVVNCEDGITPQDEEVGDFLHASGKPVVICANKADNHDRAQAAEAQFARLGFQDIETTSCTHNFGISHLMDTVVKYLPQVEVQAEEQRLRVAVVGRPNVGKSSLVNRLTGEERMMVSNIPGTTRDAVDVPVTIRGTDGEELPVMLVDTAGMRRKRQVDTVVEFFSANRTEQAIRRSDVVLFLIDSEEPCTTQERRIGKIIVDARKPCVMLANKWDLTRKVMKPAQLLAKIRYDMPFMAHAPILLISALNGFNFGEICRLLRHVSAQMKVTVPTAVFNQFLQDTLLRNPPASNGTRRFKVFYGTMVFTPPPKFVLFVNSKKLCPANYLSFLENQIREAFFREAGLPISLELRERERLEDASETRRAAAGAHRQKEADYQAKNRRVQRSRGRRKS